MEPSIMKAGRAIFWIGLAGLNLALFGYAPPAATLEGVIRERRLIDQPGGGGLAVEILRPVAEARDHAPRPSLMLVHGGSWMGGSAGIGGLGERSTALRLARAGVVIVAPDYTLARPGAPSRPRVVTELRATMRWLRREALSLGIDPKRVGALGFAAGGHLAALLGTLPDELDPDGVSARPGLVVDFYGPTDLAALEAERRLPHDPIAVFLGGAGRDDASPIHHVSADDPPHLILHGTADRWVSIEQSRRYAARLKSAGVKVRLIEVDGARHGFEAGVEFPRSVDLLPAILAFLNSVWNL